MRKNYYKITSPGLVVKTKKLNIAIICGAYWQEITDKLLKSCLQTLKEKGLFGKQVEIFEAPGALEIPLLAKKLAKKRKYNALIALGAVLKGKTYHFEQVARECVKGCMRVSYDYEIPVVFEVLCVYNEKDAKERAAKRGQEAALTALKMIKVLECLR